MALLLEIEYGQMHHRLRYADHKLTLNFRLYGSPSYSVTEMMDEVTPYLLHRYVTFNIEYDFDDITSDENVPIHYRVDGSLTMGRNINTQVPDEDQAIEW